MTPQRFAESNIEFTKPENWTDEQCASIHGFVGEIPGFKGNYADHRRTPVCVTAWRPTPDELVKLNLGEPVFLSIVGERQPPVILGVDNPWGN